MSHSEALLMQLCDAGVMQNVKRAHIIVMQSGLRTLPSALRGGDHGTDPTPRAGSVLKRSPVPSVPSHDGGAAPGA